MLTFNLVVVSGARPGFKVWEIARERLLTILMGFIVSIFVSLFVFPLWASDELHDSIVSRFHDLANTIQGIFFFDININIYYNNVVFFVTKYYVVPVFFVNKYVVP